MDDVLAALEGDLLRVESLHSSAADSDSPLEIEITVVPTGSVQNVTVHSHDLVHEALRREFGGARLQVRIGGSCECVFATGLNIDV